MKKKKTYTLFFLLCVYLDKTYSMNGSDDPIINHNGIEKKLIAHIVKSQLYPSYTFSVTRVLKKTTRVNYTIKGTLSHYKKKISITISPKKTGSIYRFINVEAHGSTERRHKTLAHSF